MKGVLGSPVAAAAAGAAMQESFGCVVANRFHQLLDDESDPFDILREAERRHQQQLQRKRRDEAAAAGAGTGAGTGTGTGGGNRGGRSPAGAAGHRAGAGGGRRESQKERKSLPVPGAQQQPDSPGGGPQPPGTRAGPRRSPLPASVLGRGRGAHDPGTCPGDKLGKVEGHCRGGREGGRGPRGPPVCSPGHPPPGLCGEA
jgi:hypothetical protein